MFVAPERAGRGLAPAGPDARAGADRAAAPPSSTSRSHPGESRTAARRLRSSTTPTCSTPRPSAAWPATSRACSTPSPPTPDRPCRDAAAAAPRPSGGSCCVEWNARRRPIPRDDCVHELFEAQARAHAGRGRRWCRRGAPDLRRARRARQPARPPPAQRWASGRTTLVGLCVERSLELVVGAARHAQGRRRLRAARPRATRPSGSPSCSRTPARRAARRRSARRRSLPAIARRGRSAATRRRGGIGPRAPTQPPRASTPTTWPT